MKNKINFSKMHGLGNDFMVVNNIKNHFIYTPEVISNISNRNTGIGFDQLLIIEKSKYFDFDFHYKIFNANGSEVSQCGNGARCFAHFVFLKKLTNKKNIYIYTKKRNIYINNINKKDITVDMGLPIFDPDKIPFLMPKYKKYYNIIVSSEKIKCSVVSIGNPHCIIKVNNINTAPVNYLGSLIEKHFLFPNCTNVGFMQIISRNIISLRVYERGVGETKACGSGACAAVVVGIMHEELDTNVQVNLLGGNLQISWDGKKESPIYMTGPSIHVYDGYIYI